MTPELSVIIPCYNEEKNIPLVLERFKKALDIMKKKIDVELILVDNNSKDNTQSVLKSELLKYRFARSVFQEKPGYGNAVFKGLNEARGEFLCWTHGDIQTPLSDTLRAYEIIRSMKNPENSYVKGKRYGRPIIDMFFTMGMSLFETLLLKKILWDINAQPNLFHRSFLDKIKNPPEDFSLDLFMYYIAKKNKYEIKRFDVHFGKRIYGDSSWNSGMKARIKFIKRTIAFSKKLKRNIR